MLEPALEEQIAFLHRENARLKKTVQNHTAKLDEMIAHLSAVETMIDGMKRKMGKEVLTFKAKPIEGETDAGI